jgi:voltage-gated potassium channel
MEDLNRFAAVDGSWIITLLAASGANEPEYPTQFHFTYGGEKGDETYNGENLTIHDIETFDLLYRDLSSRLEKEFGYISDRQRYHDSANPKLFVRHLEHPEKINALMLRIAWKATCWDMRRIQIAKTLSDTFATYLLGAIKPYSDELKKKGMGYSEYCE